MVPRLLLDIVTVGRPRDRLIKGEFDDVVSHLVIAEFLIMHPHDKRLTN